MPSDDTIKNCENKMVKAFDVFSKEVTIRVVDSQVEQMLQC